jgi:hypothetical protein
MKPMYKKKKKLMCVMYWTMAQPRRPSGDITRERTIALSVMLQFLEMDKDRSWWQ